MEKAGKQIDQGVEAVKESAEKTVDTTKDTRNRPAKPSKKAEKTVDAAKDTAQKTGEAVKRRRRKNS